MKNLYLVASAWWGIIVEGIYFCPQSPLNCALWKENVEEVMVSEL